MGCGQQRINPRASCARPVGIYGGDARRQNANPTTALCETIEKTASPFRIKEVNAHIRCVFFYCAPECSFARGGEFACFVFSTECVLHLLYFIYMQREAICIQYACVLILQQSAPSVFPLGILLVMQLTPGAIGYTCMSFTWTAHFDDEVAKGVKEQLLIPMHILIARA